MSRNVNPPSSHETIFAICDLMRDNLQRLIRICDRKLLTPDLNRPSLTLFDTHIIDEARSLVVDYERFREASYQSPASKRPNGQ